MEKYIQDIINELREFGESTTEIWRDLQSLLNTDTELKIAKDLLKI